MREESRRGFPDAIGITDFGDGDCFFVESDDGSEMGVALVFEGDLIPEIERLRGLAGLLN